jgi:ABC-type multidrug transport system permease subunit
MGHPILSASGRVEYAVSWDFPEALFTINIVFLILYTASILVLHFKVRLIFDRFQVSCILLFFLCIISKSPTLTKHSANPEDLHQPGHPQPR